MLGNLHTMQGYIHEFTLRYWDVPSNVLHLIMNYRSKSNEPFVICILKTPRFFYLSMRQIISKRSILIQI